VASEVLFTDEERKVLALYAQPSAKEFRRLVRLSVQYTLGTAILATAAVVWNVPLFAVAIWAVLALVLALRLLRARRLVGVMPRILAKYEQQQSVLTGRLSAFLAAPTEQMQCCFCAQSISTGRAITLTIPLGDGATQTLPAHASCFEQLVHPSVPFLFPDSTPPSAT